MYAGDLTVPSSRRQTSIRVARTRSYHALQGADPVDTVLEGGVTFTWLPLFAAVCTTFARPFTKSGQFGAFRDQSGNKPAPGARPECVSATAKTHEGRCPKWASVGGERSCLPSPRENRPPYIVTRMLRARFHGVSLNAYG